MAEFTVVCIHALLHLAQLDGEIDEGEVLMARAFAQVHGVGQDVVSDCMEDLPSVAVTVSALSELPKSEALRFFWQAVDMVLLDQEMTTEEALLRGLYGAAIGLQPGTWDLKDDGEHLLFVPYIDRPSL